MIELLQLQNVSFEINGSPLLTKLNATVHQGDVIGLIGKNGAGKSTLLHLLHQDLTPTTGHIKHLQNNLSLSLVEQENDAFAFGDVGSQDVALLSRWNVPANEYSTLSGGEKLKARLAKGFATSADLLLLDEPTNHLDDLSVDVLIEQMKQLNCTLILVSHDRYFLDKVCTDIWSLEEQTLIAHTGNYSSYMEEREQKRLTQQREYEKQQKMKARIEGQMKQLTSWSSAAHAASTKQEGPKMGLKEYHRVKAKKMDAQVKSKQKRLEKELEKINAEAVAPDEKVQFSMKANTKVGRRFMEVTNLTKSYGETTLFKEAQFTIQHGEKIALIGPNGSGKTTFLRIVMGQEEATGEVWLSPTANIGYLTQDVFDLPLDQTPKEIFYQDNYADRGRVQNLMNHLGFSASQWAEPIRDMSMGERVKCKLMAYILEEKDVLILDEPTNHLDLPSREQLEETLSQYNGTLLIVSHDRYFLEKTTDTELVIADKKMHKKINAPKPPQDNQANEELRLTLETERQEVLGKLSFSPPASKEYQALDARFKELTETIKTLS
ncbi:ribosomal protection-like ABC-F family protein [Aureibacillus halotolerans]|uniref:Ribosome protection protein VmlR n=1 Tax=Aureibacillus halotolerans TaxID=1508390 RepID=A0A4R6U573_9BACI|nr:ABC-F type ribosomal protection protein [Aureibacillus halotolerans]TDQ40672.1 macrolide transport system ATP-binding/permease protein [Aureibacillus halotolerans]